MQNHQIFYCVANYSNFLSTGIGIARSSIQQFPKNLFKARSRIGLRFVDTTVNYLNVFDLAAESTNYLVVDNSLIKNLGGHPSKSLSLARDPVQGDAQILIENSKIGYLGPNALSFTDYRSGPKATVSINESTIGIVESSAIKIANGISFDIEKSTLSALMPFAVSFADERNSLSSISQSFLGLGQESMKELRCNALLQIHDNLIYTKDVLNYCNSEDFENSTETVCSNNLDLVDYLDSSCKNNTIVQKHQLFPETTLLTTTSLPISTTTPEADTMSSTSTVATTTTSITTTTTIPSTTTPCIYVTTSSESDPNITSSKNISENVNFGSWSKLIDGDSVSINLFFVLLGLCLFLLLTVIILTACLIWGKGSKEKEDETEGRSSKYHLDTVKDCEMYFCPNPDRERSKSFLKYEDVDHDCKAEPLALKD